MIKLITDATCDYGSEYYKDNNIELLPMNVLIGDDIFVDDKNLDLKSFYAKLKQGSKPTTSMITPSTYEEVFEKHLKNGDDVLYIGFSSGLSGCFNACLMAKRSLEEKYNNKVYCVDSLSASQGIGILLDETLKMIKAGKDIENIVAYLENLKHRLCILLGVDNLFHLERGGRISKAQAIIGTTINLKPIIKVNEEGKLVSFKKVLGRKKMEFTLLDYVVNFLDENFKDKVFILNGDSDEDSLDLKNRIDAKLNINSTILNIGSIVGSHSGAGSLSVIFVSKVDNEEIK